jgi:hypothetical protein
LRDWSAQPSSRKSSSDELNFCFREDLTMTLMSTRRMMASAALLVSTLLAACGQHSSNSSSETLTIYQDPPTMSPLDLGLPGNSPGDTYYFSAPSCSSPCGRLIGEVFGSKTLIKPAAQANPNAEKRNNFVFHLYRWSGSNHRSRRCRLSINHS